MKKKLPVAIGTVLPVLFLMLICSFSLMAQPGTATYINTNVAATGTNAFPFNTTSNIKIQWIYAPGTFSTLGGGVGTAAPGGMLISKVYIQFATANPATVYPNFTISLGQNLGTQSNWGTVSSTTYPFTTGLTTCFFQATGFQFTGNVANAWYGITLQTPFPYDPSLSLIVEAKSTLTTAGGNGVRTQAAVTGQMQRLYGPFANVTGTSNTLLTPFGFDLIPGGPCTNPPTAGTATATPSTPVCTGTPVTLNLTGNTSGTGQTYQWESSPNIGGPWTPIGASLTSPSLIINPTTTLYYQCVVTCGASSASAPVQVTVSPPFPAGTYTINSAVITGGTNFQTFTDAVNALSCGIGGPVVFNVVNGSGPYTEQISIPPIGGASATNTITFNGNNQTLQFSSADANNRHVIKLNGADHIIIDNLNIVATAGTYGWGIHFINQADSNTVSNCTITVNNSITTAYNFLGIAMSNSVTTPISTGNNGNYNTISNNTISGGYYTVILYGNSTSGSENLNNVVSGNTLRDSYSYVVYMLGQKNGLVSSNDFSRPLRASSTTTAAVFLTTGCNNALIEKNRAHNFFDAMPTSTSTCYSFYVGADATAGQENKVINNLVYNMGGEGTLYGIYNTGGDFMHAYHNTISHDNTTAAAGTTYGLYQTTAATGLVYKNNIIKITRGGTGAKVCINFATTTSTIASNNNNFYINSAGAGTQNIGNFGGTNYLTLPLWQTTANGGIYDTASVSTDPLFVSPGTGNYKPGTLLLDNLGTPVGVTTDILNLPRSLTTPDPGAYEFAVSAGIDVGAFSLVTPLTTGCYSNLQTVVIKIKNYGSAIDFSVDPVTVTCNVSGAATATLTGTISSGTMAVNQTADVTLTGTFDMSVNGSYSFDAYTACAGDGNASNDTMITATRTRAAVVSGTVAANLSGACLSGTPVLTLTGSSGGNIQWQESTTGAAGPWTNVGSGNSSYVPGTVTQTTYYQVVVSCLTDMDTTNVDTFVVSNPLILTTTPGQRCGIGSVELVATSSAGSTPSWYANSTGGISLAAGDTFNTPTISTNTTYYVEPVVGGGGADSLAIPIASGTTTGVYHHMFLINSPTGLTVNGFGIKCNMTVGSLSSWDIYYRPDNYQLVPGSNLSSAGWTLLSTVTNVPSVGATGYTQIAMSLSLDIPAATTYSFYVAPAAGTTHQYGTTAAGTVITSNLNASIISGHRGSSLFNCNTAAGFPVVKLLYALGCVGLRVPVLATINTAPAITATSADPAVCGGNSTTLSVSSPNDSNYAYTWTSVPAGFSASGFGPHTITPVSTTTYIVSAIDTSGLAFDGCTNIDTVTVIAVGALTAGTASASQSTYCLTGTPTLTLAGSAGSIQWQESNVSATGPWTNIGTGDSTYIPPVALTQTTYFQAVVSCQAATDTSNILTIVVNSPQILTTKDSVRCGIGTVPLEATSSPTTTIDWFTSSTGGSSIGSGSPFTTPVISSTTTYYAQASTGGGSSGVTPMPPQLSAFVGNVRGYSFTAPVSFTLTGIECLSTAAGNQHVAVVRFNPPVQPPAYSASTNAFTTLFLSQNNPNLGVIPCNILINAGDVIGILGQKGTTTSYANPAGPYTTTIAGQSVVLTRMLMQFPLGTTAPMNLSTETSGSIGRVALTYEIGCASTRVPVTATVTPAPPVGITGTSVICQGSSTTLSIGAGIADYTNFVWFPATGLNMTTGSSVIASPDTTTKYYVFASGNVDSCQAVDSITVTVNAVSYQLQVDNPLVCGSDSAQLNISIGAGSFSYAWSPSAGLSSTTIANPTAQIATPSQIYTVTVTDLATACTKSGSITIYRSDPAIITAVGDTRCGTGPVILTSTGTPGLINWYNDSIGGAAISIGSPYMPTVSVTDTFYTSVKDAIVQTPVSTGFAGGTIATDPNAAGNMFNVTAINDIRITGFDVHLNDLPLTASDISIYYKAGTYVGFTTNAGAWTLAGSATGITSSGTGVPTPVPLALNINIPAGQTYGIYIVVTNLGVSNSLIYTSAANSPAEGVVAASDYNLQVRSGTVVFGPFTGLLAAPVNRLWNGNVKYSIGCESPRSMVVATVSAAPALTVSGGAAVCAGLPTSLMVSSPNDPNYTYTWFPGSLTGDSVSVNPAVTTTYTVIASDTSGGAFDGCLNSDTLVATINPLPPITSTQSSASLICGGGVPVTLTALTGSSVPGFVNIGSQTTTISGNVGNPYRSGNVVGNQIRTQLLVLASELTAGGFSAGNLTSLAFTAISAAGTMVNFSISIGHTGLSTLTTSYVVTPMTTVFTQASFNAVIGLNTHVFSTPFAWDGTSNIIINVCQQNSVLGTTSVAAYTPGYSSNLANAVVGGCTAATGTLVANKPIMRIGGTIGSSGPGTFLWQWSPGIIPPGNVASTTPLTSTTYTVTATNNVTGCTSTSTVFVQVTPLPQAYAFPFDTTLCTGSVITITARDSGAYAGGWPVGTLFDYGFGPTPDSSFVVNGPGLYNVQVTLPLVLGGCAAFSGNASIFYRDAPVLFVGTDSVRCKGESNGYVSAQSFLGVPPYRFIYYNNLGNVIKDTISGLAEDTLFNLPAGQYSVVVYDTANAVYPPPSCRSDSIVVEVPEPDELIAAESYPVIDCFGNSTQVTISATGGTPPYTGTGVFTQFAGSQTYYISDNNGCTDSITVVITEPDVLGVTLAVANNICAYSTVSITKTVTGGTAPYTYLWNDGSTNGNRSSVPGGTYTITVTDDHGCTASSSVTVTPPGAVQVLVASTNPVCKGAATGTITLTINGGVPAYTFLWNNGSTVQNRTGLVAGTYTVTVTDINGCTKSKPVNISQPAKSLILNTSKTNVRCFGLSSGVATVTPSGGTAPYSYSWNTFPVQTTASITGLSAGVFVCTVTDAIGCVKTATITITQPTDMVIFQTQSNVTVNGGNDGSATVSVSGGTPGYTYSWNTVPVQTTTSITGLTAGTYKCTIRDTKNCTKKVTFIITEPIVRLPGFNSGNPEWKINAYPNPTSGILMISFESESEVSFNVSLTDYTGRVVYQKRSQASTGTNEFVYDFSIFAKGVYFVKVVSDDRQKIIRILIQ